MHTVSLANGSPTAVNVTVAPAAPEDTLPDVNVVVPHPVEVGTDNVPKVNVGNTIEITSPDQSSVLRAKVRVTAVGYAVTGSDRSMIEVVNFGVRSFTAVETVMDPVAATIFAADANVTADVRVLRFAACALTLVVIPVLTVTVHSVSVGSTALNAVKVNVALATPVLDPPAPKVVAPHPLDVLTSLGVFTIKKVGSTSAIASLISSKVLSLKVYETEVGRSVYGSERTSLLSTNAVTVVSVDLLIAVAATLATDASLCTTAAVRLAKLALCAFAAVVTPVEIVTLHS